ncbi:hypothetical protein AB0L74_10235 [Streptomyces sp. NPDC052020]
MSKWSLWGDGPDPLTVDLTEDQARWSLREFAAEGRTDVYAENEDGDVIE